MFLKVDFDLTLSFFAPNVYRKFAVNVSKYEKYAGERFVKIHYRNGLMLN